MKLTCPGCGAVASAECWHNDLKTREAMAALATIPAPANAQVFGYLSLFRPDQRALSWGKTLRLLTELSGLIGKGYVSQQGCIDRHCPPSVWAKAMEQMAEQRYSLSLPMKSHGYLRKVAYDLAAQLDAKAESSRNNHATITPSQVPADDPRRDPLYAIKKKWDEEHGLGGKIDKIGNID